MPLPQTAQIASQQAGYLAKCFDQETMDLCDEFKNADRGTLAYIGGTSALYKVPGFLPLPNFTGLLGWFTWRSAYWSMQLSLRNKAMLAWNWCANWAFGRDLTRVGRHSSPVGDAWGLDRKVSDGQKSHKIAKVQ